MSEPEARKADPSAQAAVQELKVIVDILTQRCVNHAVDVAVRSVQLAEVGEKVAAMAKEVEALKAAKLKQPGKVTK